MMTPTWDLVVHKWDLAKGTAQNTALDDSFVEAVYSTFAPMADGNGGSTHRWPGSHGVGGRKLAGQIAMGIWHSAII